MTTIEIDQDIHNYLLQRVKNFGESASDVLRRELGLNEKNRPSTNNTTQNHELTEALESSKIKHARGVVGKFLAILSVAFAQNKEAFNLVLSIQGRGRTYFAKSKKEIEASGNSTQPKQIPDSPYWVMTNSPTTQKKEMLSEVLKGLGYSAKAVMAATQEIGV